MVTMHRATTAQRDQLQEWARQAQANLLVPSQTNFDRARLEGRSLRLRPANSDPASIIYVHVDKEPDFVWPWTYSYVENSVIQWRYVLHPEFEAAYTILPQMEGRIDWVSLADFKPWEYESVWGGRLAVPNSWIQQGRALETAYELMPWITQHAFSADKHGEHSIWDTFNWVARYDTQYDGGPVVGTYQVKKGSHPQVFTIIAPDSVYHQKENPDGLWQPVREPDWTYEYAHGLLPEQMNMWRDLFVSMNKEHIYEAHHGSLASFDEDTFNAADYQTEIDQLFNPDDYAMFILPLWIWSYHCERETFGGSIDPMFWQMAQRHAGARLVDILLYEKGKDHSSEHFGIFLQEKPKPGSPYGKPNLPALQLYQTADLLIFDGEAKYNCVARTLEQAHQYVMQHDRSAVKKFRVVVDQTTAIAGTEYRQASFDLMAETGVVFCTAAELMDELASMGARYA